MSPLTVPLLCPGRGGGIDGYLSLPEGPRLIFGNLTRYNRISHEMDGPGPNVSPSMSHMQSKLIPVEFKNNKYI